MSVQPSTRWVFPPKFQPDIPPPLPPVQVDGTESLTSLLISDLSQGHYNVAIRHFLMLKRCGGKVPALIERSCEQLLREIPASRQRKIALDVERWLDMVSAHPKK